MTHPATRLCRSGAAELQPESGKIIRAAAMQPEILEAYMRCVLAFSFCLFYGDENAMIQKFKRHKKAGGNIDAKHLIIAVLLGIFIFAFLNFRRGVSF
jgi:hypothetical protein